MKIEVFKYSRKDGKRKTDKAGYVDWNVETRDNKIMITNEDKNTYSIEVGK